MDKINLSITSIKLPADKTLESTSYQVATDGLFNDDDLVVDVEEDEENLTDIDLDLDFTASDVYYARVKLHFDDDTVYGWTKPIILTRDGDGFSHNNTVIVTPEVGISSDAENCQLGNFNISGGDFVIFTGVGYHQRTTWAIKDNSGATIWEVKRDENNLTNIRVPSDKLDPNKIYVIEVTYISNNNMMSNPGKLIIKTTGDATDVNNIEFGGDRDIIAENEDLKEALDYSLGNLVDLLIVQS